MASSNLKRDSDRNELEQLVHQYFDGLHFGDDVLLGSIFHGDCVLKAPGLRRDKTAWLKRVKTRNKPQELGHAYAYRLQWIDIEGDQAMAKIYCPLLGDEFVDYLGFLYENGRWQIVNKMYSDRFRATT